MRLRFFLGISLVLMLFGCNNVDGKQNRNLEGSDKMQWEDKYFMEICSQVFDKPGKEITYDELAKITKISYFLIERERKVSVSLSDVSEPKIVDRPEISMKSVADLACFKNLSEIHFDGHKYKGTEVLKHLSNLKTLTVWGNINQKMLANISESDSITSLTVCFLDLDYSVLAQKKNLKTIILTDSYDSPTNYSPLLALPRENCLIELEFINNQAITPELYELLCTHPNISKIGRIDMDDYDISFLAEMKHLTSLAITTNDISSISKMTWLRELYLRGNFGTAELPQLSGLSDLESLRLYTYEEQQIITLDVLSHMKRLQELNLGGFVIFSLDGIQALTELRSLTCNSSLLEDISAIRRLYQLESLILDDNLISDIDALGSLTKLKHVSIYSNEIFDITPLKNCVNIEFLCLDNNYITDIRALSNLPKIEELQIQVDSETEKNINLTLWRNTLRTLPNLKFYVGGIDDMEWIGENLPNVIHARSEMWLWSEELKRRESKE